MKTAKRNIWVVLTILTGLFLASPFVYGREGSHGVDLGIGRGDSHRPNILVAWRNTERILEVELLVRNLGDRQGTGQVWLDLADDEGKTLLSTDPVPVTVPPRTAGGDEGVVIQEKGFRLMNLMFDQLDRLNQRYKLRARVKTDGDDLNPLDNIVAKTFNVDGRALPSTTNFYRFRFLNSTGATVSGRINLENTAVPKGWQVKVDPKPGTTVTLEPKQAFTGYITVKTPTSLANGEFVDFQVGLIGDHEGTPYVIDTDEWYLVADSLLPEVGQPSVTARPDGSIMVNVVANDPICGLKEASGVQVGYSLDDGTTFSDRVMAYTRGNFYTKTWFEAQLGPFAPGVKVKTVVTVQNNAGLTRRFDLAPVEIQHVVQPVTPSADRAKGDVL